MSPGLVRFAATLSAPLFLLTHPLRPQADPAPGAACASAEHHQFDFWIGDWDVALPDGSRAGANHIESILQGCVLRESWAGARGSHGTSYNIYDAARRRWHQTWVDDGGHLLVLEGSFAGERMTLEGESADSAGRVQRQRIVWEQTAPGRVRQLWEISSDGGATWTTAFDGRYTRR
jgi:hypothetical protein